MSTETTMERRTQQAVDEGRGAVADARAGLADAVDTLRAGGDLGGRLPNIAEAIRLGAKDGARTVRSWPDPTQRLAAAFSLGLGIGLTLAGAPRVAVAAALLPAFAVALATLGDSAGRKGWVE
jgi:hypothetical protein